MSKKVEEDETIEIFEPKKKSKFGLYFFLTVFACLAILLAYKYLTYNPIMSMIDSIPTKRKNISEEPVKVTGNFTVESKGKELKMFSVYSIDFSETIDIKNKKELVNININEGDASLIDFIFYKENKDYYLESSKLYDGKIIINDDSLKKLGLNFLVGESEGLVNFDFSEEEEEYIIRLFKQSLKNAFKDVKYTTSTKKLDFNGELLNAKGYTYSINKSNIQTIFNNFINTYEDEEFTKILVKHGISRENYKEALKEIKGIGFNDFESNIEFTIYVNPYILRYVGLSVRSNGTDIVNAVRGNDYSKVVVDFNDDELTTFVAETKGDKTEFEVNVGSMSVIKGNVLAKENNEYNFTMDIANELTIKLNTQYKENAVMDKYDTSEAIKVEDLNEEDYASIMYNLQLLSGSSPLLQSLFTFFQDDSIETATQNIYISAYQMYTNDSKKTKKSEYVYGNGNKCTTSLPININSNIKYAIKINKKGKVTYFQITDGEQQYSYKGSSLDLEKIKYTDYKGLKVTCK